MMHVLIKCFNIERCLAAVDAMGSTARARHHDAPTSGMPSRLAQSVSAGGPMRFCRLACLLRARRDIVTEKRSKEALRRNRANVGRTRSVSHARDRLFIYIAADSHRRLATIAQQAAHARRHGRCRMPLYQQARSRVIVAGDSPLPSPPQSRR